MKCGRKPLCLKDVKAELRHQGFKPRRLLGVQYDDWEFFECFASGQTIPSRPFFLCAWEPQPLLLRRQLPQLAEVLKLELPPSLGRLESQPLFHAQELSRRDFTP